MGDPCTRCWARDAVGECCSSHQRLLCHACYRWTHFVEVCAQECDDCRAEGLPMKRVPDAGDS